MPGAHTHDIAFDRPLSGSPTHHAICIRRAALRVTAGYAIALLAMLSSLSTNSRAQTVTEPAEPSESSQRQVRALHEEGRRWYVRRAEGAEGQLPSSEPIARSVELLSAAIEQEPGDLQVRADLLRSLLFEAEYVAQGKSEKKRLFEQGRLLFESGVEQVERKHDVRDLFDLEPDRLRELQRREPATGALVFWGAVHYGLWGEYYGNLAAARRGLAKKLLRFGEAARIMVPEIDSLGPSRFLGRLHHLTPRIPFLTLWADRDRAVELLSEAATQAPAEPLNQLFYAEALWELRGRDEQALSILRSAAMAPPRATHQVEDARAHERIRQLIARIEGK